MSLRHQFATLLIVLSVILVGMTYAVQVLVVMPAFAELERQEARRDLDRCVDAIGRDLELLSSSTLDWSAWDDTYEFVAGRNEHFRRATLTENTLQNADLSLMCILNPDHKLVWFDARDLSTNEQIDLPELLSLVQKPHAKINLFEEVADAHTGLLPTQRGPMLFASRPIVTSENKGPIRGTMILGRLLDASEIASLRERTHVDMEIWDTVARKIPADERQVLKLRRAPDTKVVQIHDEHTLHAYTVVNDLLGAPLLLVRADVPRKVTAQGSVAVALATISSIVGGLLTLLALWIVLQWRIIGPLQKMAGHAVRVGKDDDLNARLRLARRDEIGTLAAEFDRMVEHLAESRKKVLETAHRAGMAEIASEVLHNVGNAVNSANCSVEMLEDRLGSSKVEGLARATTLLREQAPRAAEFFNHDPRGAKLIEYFEGLNDTLQQERVHNQAEVSRLRDTVRHIRDAIAAQQTFARRSDFRQEVDFRALVDEALCMNEELIRESRVQVTVDLPPLPELRLNKSKIVQVLVNLIRNAVEAMQGQPPDGRRLRIAASPDADGGIEIEVQDTGAGFSDEVRANLFTHGFTTKPQGNGLGLHYCANAIREVGGHIAAQSPGPGRGATFRVRLPEAMPQPAAAST